MSTTTILKSFFPNIIVDGGLYDKAEEFFTYHDSKVKDLPLLPKLDSFFNVESKIEDENKNLTPKPILFETIVQNLDFLNDSKNVKISTKEFEKIYNLIFYIISFSEDYKTLIDLILKKFENFANELNGPQILNSITILFNLLSSSLNDESDSTVDNSELLFNIFNSILNIIEKTENYKFLSESSFIKNKKLYIIFKNWKIDNNKQLEIYYKISNLLKKNPENDNKLNKLSYEILYEGLENLPISTYPITTSLVITALNSDFIYRFNDLLSLEAVDDLRFSELILFNLLTVLNNGDLNGFIEFIEKNPFFLKENLIDEKIIQKKITILSLVSKISQLIFKNSDSISNSNLDSSTNSSSNTNPNPNPRIIKYSDISKSLNNIPIDDIETLIIDTIKLGLLEGQLNQIKQEFEVNKI